MTKWKLTQTSFNKTELDDSFVTVCDVFNHFVYLYNLGTFSKYAMLKGNLED